MSRPALLTELRRDKLGTDLKILDPVLSTSSAGCELCSFGSSFSRQAESWEFIRQMALKHLRSLSVAEIYQRKPSLLMRYIWIWSTENGFV